MNIGLGRGRVGDEDADAGIWGLGLLLAIRAAVNLGDNGDGVGGGRVETEDRGGGGGRFGNLMRSFRDSVVSWRARTGGAVVDSALTNSGVFSSPSLSSSITSVSGSDAEGRRTVGLVVRARTGAGAGAIVMGLGLGVWLSGELGIGAV